MSQKRVLIVDDDANLLEVLQLRFAKTDFDVIVAADGRTALQILRECEPLDLVLTDFMMPERHRTDPRHQGQFQAVRYAGRSDVKQRRSGVSTAGYRTGSTRLFPEDGGRTHYR